MYSRPPNAFSLLSQHKKIICVCVCKFRFTYFSTILHVCLCFKSMQICSTFRRFFVIYAQNAITIQENKNKTREKKVVPRMLLLVQSICRCLFGTRSFAIDESRWNQNLFAYMQFFRYTAWTT